MNGADTRDRLPTIEISEEKGFEQLTVEYIHEWASFEVAKRVLVIFAGVYLLSFVMSFCMFFMEGADFQGALELVRFLLGSVLPLVTLVVGYYLGERSSSART